MINFVRNGYKLTTLVIYFFLSFAVHSDITRVAVFTDKPFYTAGEIPKIFVSAKNHRLESNIVDVHVGLIDPHGKIYEYPDWNTTFSPWIPLIEIPAEFEFPTTFVADATYFPGEITPGMWHAGIALTEPGTFQLVSVNIVPFSMLLPTDNAERKFGHVVLKLENDRVTLQGGFLSLSGVFSDAIALIVGPQAEIDQCSIGMFGLGMSSFKPEVNASFLDAGSDLLVSSNSTFEQRLTPSSAKAFTNYSTATNPPLEFYKAGETYTLSSLGGTDLDSFNSSVIAPSTIIVSQPDFTSPLVITSDQNLKLKWNGNDGIGEIIVTLISPNLISDSYMIKCRFADDGIASVPEKLLKQLNEFTNPEAIFSPELSIERIATGQYRTLNEKLDYGVFEIRAVTSTFFSFSE